MASIMTVHEDGTRTFTVYDAAKENERDRGKITSRMVRALFSPPLNSADSMLVQNMPYFV